MAKSDVGGFVSRIFDTEVDQTPGRMLAYQILRVILKRECTKGRNSPLEVYAKDLPGLQLQRRMDQPC